MDVQNISEVVIAVVVAVMGAVTPYLAQFIKSNKTAQTLVDILPTLAKDAVVAMQKLGATTYIEGAVKKSEAVKTVETSLQKLGFTKTDEATIVNAVESAYASLTSDGTLAPYKQVTVQPQAKEQTDELKAAQEAVAAAQTALAQAQAFAATMAANAEDPATSAQSSVISQTSDSSAESATVASSGDVK